MKIKPNIIEIPEFTVVSAMRTPDGTLLISSHRHDYVTHEDANGKHYMLDGGTDDYYRSSVNGDEEMIRLTSNTPHIELREWLGRAGYGKDGKGEFRFTKLKDMTDEHLAATIKYVEERGEGDKSAWYIKLYRKEQRYRRENNIKITDNE